MQNLLNRPEQTSEWIADARRRHENCTRAGVPVIPFVAFEVAALELIDADADFGLAYRECWVEIERRASDGHRFPGWVAYEPEPIPSLDRLLTEFNEINRLHPSDLQFKLVHGKSPRNPLAAMARRARSLRSQAAKLRRAVARLTAARDAYADSRGRFDR